MIEFIKSFEGIIGTVIGIILGSLITLITKRSGKILCYLNSVKLTFQKLELGMMNTVTKDDNPQLGIMDFEIELFNGSDTPKIIRGLKVSVISKHYSFKKEIDDLSTFQLIAAQPHTEELKHINLQPHNLIKLNLRVVFNGNELNNILSDVLEVFIIGSKPNYIFKKFKFFIAKIDKGEIIKK